MIIEHVWDLSFDTCTNIVDVYINYSTAQVDKRKVGKLAQAIQVAFQELGAMPGESTNIPVETVDPGPAISAPHKGVLPTPNDNGDLTALQKDLEKALAKEIARGEVALSSGPDGLVVSLREFGFFDSGSAGTKANSRSAFGRMAVLLEERNFRIRIEGHTDNIPIHNGAFSSNWELSTTRATETVRLLITKYGFAPERLSAGGYSEYHPIASNDTEEGRALNRRVDVVILSKR
jgi:chemotaxis protein MotB